MDNEAARVEVASRALAQTLVRASESAPVGLSGAQLSALRAIERRGQLNMTELAGELGTIPSWASRLCDRLEADGYIERKLHETGRRQVTIRLRSSGQKVLAEIAERRAGALVEVLAAMTPTDREALLRGLDAFGSARDVISQDRTASA